MNIKVADLRKFQKLSAHIRPTGIIPASDCIKFGGGVIVKNANSAFLSYDCVDSADDILVDEHSLNGLVNATASDFINISKKGAKVILSDGRDKIPVGLMDVKEFGVLPVPEGERKDIDVDFLSVLGKTSEACSDRKSDTTLYMFVHVGNNMMAAGNGFMGVCFPIKEDYKMVIDKTIAKFLSKQQIVEWAETESHYLFYGVGCFWGFSKQEIGFSGFGKMIQDAAAKITFTVSATDVISFNSLAMSLSFEKDITVATMAPGRFETIKGGDEEPCIRPYDGLTLSEPFHYNPEYLNRVIAALDVEELDFCNSGGAYFISSKDTKATAIIAKIQK